MTSTPPPGGGYQSGGSWGWSASGRGAGPSSSPSPSPSPNPQPSPSSPSGLDPLSRRLLQVAGGLSVLLIAIVVFSWMHGGGEGSLNPIAQAAARTEKASGARMKVHYIYKLPSLGKTFTASGEGAFNGETGRTRLSIDVLLPTGNVGFEAVGDQSTVYMRGDSLQDELPPGDEWMALEFGVVNSTQPSAAAGNSDFKAQLDQLRSIGGEVEKLGRERVRGIRTTRYRAAIDFADYASYLRDQDSELAADQYEQIMQTIQMTNDVEVWVDARGLLRRVTTTVDFQESQADQPSAMVMTVDFFDYGAAPNIQLPDPDTVYDATSQIRAKLGLDG